MPRARSAAVWPVLAILPARRCLASFAMSTTSRLLSLFSLALMVLLGGPAQAGGTATVLASEDFAQPQYRVVRSTVEFDGSAHVRVQAEGRREGYLIVRDGTPWAVTALEGQPLVLNFAQMMQTMGGMARSLAPRSLITDGRYVNLTGPGAVETVAGISGRIWQLTTVNKAGRQRTDEVGDLLRSPRYFFFSALPGTSKTRPQ